MEEADDATDVGGGANEGEEVGGEEAARAPALAAGKGGGDKKGSISSMRMLRLRDTGRELLSLSCE